MLVETLSRRRAYALGLVADRTRELEETVGELGETRAFLELLLTAGPVVVIRVEPADRLVTYVSRNVERILGVPRDDVLARGVLERRIHPDDAPAFASAIERLARGDRPDRGGAGGPLAVRRRRVPVDLDDARRPRPTARARPSSATSSTSTTAGAAERAQREAQEAAEAANRSKSQFLSRMSHELRTPLNAVLGFGQLLEMGSLDAAQRDSVEHILKGGRHLLDLINEVLDISRIEAGELSLSPEPVLAAELIRESVDLIRPLAEQRGLQLAVGGSGDCDGYLFADRQRLKQVLLNLLANAVKYNRAGGAVAVSCELPSETRMRISVIDTGMGIAAERLGLLFAPFERLGAEQTGEEGTGIGLALSKRLTEAMGGTLEATSTLGQGSTFTVELPRVEGPVERYQRLNGGGGAGEPATAGRARPGGAPDRGQPGQRRAGRADPGPAAGRRGRRGHAGTPRPGAGARAPPGARPAGPAPARHGRRAGAAAPARRRRHRRDPGRHRQRRRHPRPGAAAAQRRRRRLPAPSRSTSASCSAILDEATVGG